MNGQINFDCFTHDRNGNIEIAPLWMKKERCENCKYWEILPVEEQPPCGWGVRGQCNCVHEPERMQQGYWKVDSTSYCQDFAPKW